MDYKKKLIDTWDIISQETEKKNNKVYRVVLNHKYITVRACILGQSKNKSIEFVYNKTFFLKKLFNNIDTNGLEIQIIKDLEDSKNNIISIKLKKNSLLEIYLEFIENIIKYIQPLNNKDEIINLIIKKIDIWIKFFKREKFDGLSEEEIRGLIGELLFIKNFSKNKENFKNNIIRWKGCENGLHDFEFQKTKVEIKTFSSTGKIRITYPDQLDIDTFPEIYLVCFNLTKDNGNFSLNSIINLIKKSIDEKTLIIFEDKLKNAGYFEIHKNNYNDEYNNSKKYCYKIVKEFPKILYKELNDSISKVSYSLDTNLLSSFDIGSKQIEDIIGDKKN